MMPGDESSNSQLGEGRIGLVSDDEGRLVVKGVEAMG